MKILCKSVLLMIVALNVLSPVYVLADSVLSQQAVNVVVSQETNTDKFVRNVSRFAVYCIAGAVCVQGLRLNRNKAVSDRKNKKVIES